VIQQTPSEAAAACCLEAVSTAAHHEEVLVVAVYPFGELAALLLGKFEGVQERVVAACGGGCAHSDGLRAWAGVDPWEVEQQRTALEVSNNPTSTAAAQGGQLPARGTMRPTFAGPCLPPPFCFASTFSVHAST